MMMEPLSKVAKYDEAKRGCAPQRNIKIDVTQVHKLQKIAKQCEEKLISNCVPEIHQSDSNTKESGGKKLELIVGKLASTEKVAVRKDITGRQSQDCSCQSNFDIEKMVCDMLQKRFSLKQQLSSSFINSKVTSLMEENAKLREKAKSMEAKLDVALDLLKKAEKVKAKSTNAVPPPVPPAVDKEKPHSTGVTKSNEMMCLPPQQGFKTSAPSSLPPTGIQPRPTVAPVSQSRAGPPPHYPKHYTQASPVHPYSRHIAAQMTANSIAMQQKGGHPTIQSSRVPPVNTTHMVYSSRVPQRTPPATHQPANSSTRFSTVPNFSNATRLSENVWQIAAQHSPTFQQVNSMPPAPRVYTQQQRPTVQLVQAVPVPVQVTIPPAVKLSISNSDAGIVLSWDLLTPTDDASIVDVYHLYACQGSEVDQRAPAQWKRIGVVKALPLPMACTLTQFVRGSSYHFVVAPIDRNGVQGDLSNSCTMRLGNG